jgi:hypothetical protein
MNLSGADAPPALPSGAGLGVIGALRGESADDGCRPTLGGAERGLDRTAARLDVTD